MLKLLKRIFRRDPTTATAAVAPAPAAAPRALDKAMGNGVEVASLSLRAILEKLPPELQPIINQLPDPAVRIMLPVNTILKQLPGGAVRMSFASLLRQAPHGTFRKADIEEKQMVDVPLSEVFKNVDAKRLGRRPDQRRYNVPDDATGLFGKNGGNRDLRNPAEDVVPQAPVPEAVAPVAPPQMPVESLETSIPVAQPRIVKMPGLPSSASEATNGNGHGGPRTPAPAVTTQKAPANPAGGELIIPFVELAAGWPEGIRSELTLVPGDTKLVIPAVSVSAGLQKGKVEFPWSQVRMWMRPSVPGTTGIPDDFTLVLPLRIIAPAFVAATGASKRREAVEVDRSLPDFFGPSAGQKPAPQPETPKIPAPVAAPVAGILAPAPIESPAPAAAPLKFTLVREEPVPVRNALPLVAPGVEQRPISSPADLVKQACSLAGVAGAVVALEEGLVVAQNLPASFSADTLAAFLPQILSRLEKYTTEMQLGAASEITIHSENGPCHIARSGKIYFCAIGFPGKRLPEELAALTAQVATLNS